MSSNLNVFFILNIEICVYIQNFLLSYIYNSLLLNFFPLFLCSVGYIVAFTQVLKIYQVYLTYSSLSQPPLIPGIVSTDITFAFTYMCTCFLHCIHPLPSFSITYSLPLVPALSPGQDLSYPLSLYFCRRKK
jgi:hypothetical protein